MKAISEEQIAELIQMVQSAEKYRHIAPDLVREIGIREIAKRGSIKEAVKSTRNKLHQIGLAYQERTIPYEQLTQDLTNLPTTLNESLVTAWLRQGMMAHTSSEERLPTIEHFFKETLAPIAPVSSILDLAGGLNPLALPWMPVAVDVAYSAYDIYQDMADFLNRYFHHFKINGTAEVCDLTQNIPQKSAQVAFLLKAIPCLEQVDKQAGIRLMDELNVDNLLVSFPAHSLGGKSKGMVQNYEAHFMQLVEGRPWKINRFEFTSELAFLVQKNPEKP